MNTFSSFRARLPRRGVLRIFPVLPAVLAALLVLVLPVSRARGAPLGQNTLSLGTASGPSGTDVIVPLGLANQDAVGGIQLDIRFDPAVVSFTSAAITSRVTGMSIGTSIPAPDTLRVLMYFGGGGNLAVGAGAVANLTFHLIGTGGTTLTPDGWELSDPNGQRLQNVTATAGEITVTGGTDPTGACCAPAGDCTVTTQAGCAAPNTWRGAGTTCIPNLCPPQATETLSIGIGSGASGVEVTVPLSLQNTRAISALQLDIRFDPAVVSFTSAAITSRATGMSIGTSTPAPDTLRVVMYFGGGGNIPAGDGAVANLIFRIIGAQGSGCDLTPDAATLSDPEAQTVPVTATGGHISVTGGGDPTGACCAPAGTCTLVTQPGCTAGTWRGPNTVCTPNPCAQPTGSCCVPAGTCTVTMQANCTGVWTVNGVCTPNPCAQPTGSCCVPAGTCTVTTQANCTNGTWTLGGVCTPNPCPPGPASDTLSVGSGAGASGTEVTVPLNLRNLQPIKGLQLDIRFTASVVSWVDGTAALRDSGMAFSAEPQGTDGVRIVMYYADAATLAAGDGTIANLVFQLGGAAGTSSALALSGVIVADPAGQEILTVGSPGLVSVIGVSPPPDLRLAVLQNPGRTRTLQIFVTSDVGLDAPPTVSLSGGGAVAMTQLPSANIFLGNISVDDGTASVTVQATGIHDGATETVQSTVTF